VDEVLDAVEKTSKKTALHFASEEGHALMVSFLLNKGARVDSRDKLLRIPLHLAA
jgi:ankyrin repeat protein